MADDNEVSIVIKAVNDASGVLKQIAADTKVLATIATRLEKSLGQVTAAQKANVVATKDAGKAAIDAAKVGKLQAATDLDRAKAAGVAAQASAKVSTEEERAAAVLLKSQAQINQVNQQAMLIAQRRMTEEQRTNKAAVDEAMNRAAKVGKIVGDAAKTDAQVAGIQIRNNAMLEESERKKQREYERTAKAAEQKARAELKAANAAKDAAEQPGMTEKLKDLASELAPAIALLAAFGVAAKKAFDFAEVGAQVERLRVTGTALAKGFGVDMADAVAKLKAASLGTLSAQQVILATNRSLLLGIAADTDKLAVLMEIAAVRGRAMGLNTTDSFDRITLGIGRLSTRILDDIGIVIDGEAAYAKYGAAIGKVADDLSEPEKRIALTNAIIEDGNELLSATGGLVADNAAAFEKFRAELTDTKNEWAEMMAGPAADFIKFTNEFLFGGRGARRELEAEISLLSETTHSYDEYVAAVEKLVSAHVGWTVEINEAGEAVTILHDGVEQLVGVGNALTKTQYELAASAHELSEADKTAGAHTEQLNEILRERERALQEARDAIEPYIASIENFSIVQAQQSAIAATANENLGRTEKELQSMQVQFGLLSVEVIKFNAAIEEAAMDGVVSMNEFRDAFFPVAQAQIANLREELGKGLVDIQDETIKKLDDLRADYQSDLLKDGIGLTRDLEDIELDRNRALEDLTSESTEKRGDEERKHKDKLVDIERDYQRDIDKIMRKFEMSRLRALIDLDARALFEAEQQRDNDLKDASDTAKDKREDEEKDYEKRLEDLDDFNKEKKEAIDKDYRRERADAQTQYDRQRDDADAAMEDRRRDIEEDAAQRLADLADDFEEQKGVIEAQLGIIQTNYQDAYNERVEDMLDFFDTNQNILLALKNGTVSLSDLRDQFNATGGIPFGGVPFTPDPTEPPPPPPTHNCQPGYSWNPVTLRCEQDPQLVPGNNVVTPAAGTVVGTVKLEIVGDGQLARMVRESAANVFAEIIAE